MKLPQRALTNYDLLKFAKKLKIPHFRGVFMRNDLPKNGPHNEESAIINLDDKESKGTHWVCYRKFGSHVFYSDSFGDLRPPLELVNYFGSGSII